MQSKKAALEEREYGKNPLSEKELREIIGDDPIEGFLNTRTPLYREKNMKQKPPSKDEAIKLMLKGFRAEVDALVRDKVDVTRSLPGFIAYRVRSQTDPAVKAAAEICPTRAIVKDGQDQWMVDDRLCILCGACKEVAPEAMAVVDRFQPPMVFPETVAAAGG